MGYPNPVPAWRPARSVSSIPRQTGAGESGGDILVVPVIDPGMAPLFGLAAGVIAEMGGTLSHGAIIAREYGLPVLVNVPYATSLLREHDWVTIVSSTGTISRVVLDVSLCFSYSPRFPTICGGLEFPHRGVLVGKPHD